MDSPYCQLLQKNQDVIMIMMWLFSMPLAGCCCVFRACCGRNTVRIWMVIHANVSFWIWIILILSTFTFCDNGVYNWHHKDVLISMGTFFLMLSILISLLSALATDNLYPDCRLSQKDMVKFIEHLRAKDPELVMVLPVRERSQEGSWEKAKRVYPSKQWIDSSMHLDNLNIENEERAYLYKIELLLSPVNEEAKYDMESFIWCFGREYDVTTYPDGQNYKLNGSINPPPNNKDNNQNLAHQCAKGISDNFPQITTIKSVRIYVSKDGQMSPMTDMTLRFSWLLNMIGLSSVVLATLKHWKERTKHIKIYKRFHARERCRELVPVPNQLNPPPPPPYSLNDSNNDNNDDDDDDKPPSYDSIV